MGHSLKNAYVADLPHGAVLVIHPTHGVDLFSDAGAAVRWLGRAGWDYFVTHQNTDTGDEIEQWIPLHDARWEAEER